MTARGLLMAAAGGLPGTLWTQQTGALPVSGFWWGWGGAFGNNMFVAFRNTTSNIAASSPDGITWTSRTMPSSYAWGLMAYGGGVFVTTARNAAAGTTAATSTNGTTWTAMTLPSGVWGALTWGNNLFVLTPFGSATCYTSPNGTAWTPRTLPLNDNWSGVVYGNSRFVAFTTAGVTATSTNGTTWVSGGTLPNQGASNSFGSFGFGGGLFVAVVDSVSGPPIGVVATSPDGVTWTARTLPTAGRFVWGAYGMGAYVVADSSNPVMAVSVDAINWQSVTVPLPAISVAYGNGRFVALSNTSTTSVLTSP